MMRIALFLATNMAILVVASITLNLLGFNSIMAANGVDLNLSALLIFCAVFGMSGALVSLLISKWMAKRSMGVRLIYQPRNQQELWLKNITAELAQKAGIGMPEVGISLRQPPMPSPPALIATRLWSRLARVCWIGLAPKKPRPLWPMKLAMLPMAI